MTTDPASSPTPAVPSDPPAAASAEPGSAPGEQGGASAEPGSAPGSPASMSRPPRARLRRPREGRLIAGIGAGLAGHLGVDVVLVRVVLVVLAFLTNGLLVLAYLIAIPFLPVGEPDRMARVAGRGPAGGVAAPAAGDVAAAGSSVAAGADPTASRDAMFWVGIGVLVIGVALLLGLGAPVGAVLGSSVLLPLVLIAFGVALWRSSDRPTTPAPAYPGPQTPPWATAPTSRSESFMSDSRTASSTGTASAAASMSVPAPSASAPSVSAPSTSAPSAGNGGWGEAAGGSNASDAGRAADETGAPPPGTPPWAVDGGGWQPPPVPPRRRSLLGRLTFGLASITVGVLWALHLAGAYTVTPGQLLASVLLVIGFGALVGSVVGRAPSVLVIGVLLVPLVLLASLARPFGADSWWWQGDAPVGEQRIAATSWDQVDDAYELGAGSLSLNLSEIELDGVDRTIELSVGAGEVFVSVPEGLGLNVTARNGLGEIRLPDSGATTAFGQQRSFGQRGEPGAGTLDLQLSLGVGVIEVMVLPRMDDAADPGAAVPSPEVPADGEGPADGDAPQDDDVTLDGDPLPDDAATEDGEPQPGAAATEGGEPLPDDIATEDGEPQPGVAGVAMVYEAGAPAAMSLVGS